MPAAHYINMGTVFDPGFFSIQHIAIMRMATVFQKRIEPASLLPHIPQTKISSAFIYIIAYFKFRRLLLHPPANNNVRVF